MSDIISVSPQLQPKKTFKLICTSCILRLNIHYYSVSITTDTVLHYIRLDHSIIISYFEKQNDIKQHKLDQIRQADTNINNNILGRDHATRTAALRIVSTRHE